ncbi:YceI family protein [bacterium]|nr:YceI family protein [bacterium]
MKVIYRDKILLLFLILFGLIAIIPVEAEEMSFLIKAGDPNLVKFTSEAKLETVMGVTNNITGSMSFDHENLKAGVSAEFTVDMASIDTDNSIRNGHMRDNHLHTSQFPFSKFIMKGFKGDPPSALIAHEKIEFSIVGDFTLHGITHEIEPEIVATWKPDKNMAEIEAHFVVKLADYDIPRPKFLILKLDEEQKIDIKFQAIKK